MSNAMHFVPLLSASGEDVILVPRGDIAFVEVTHRDQFDHIPTYRHSDDAPWGLPALHYLHPPPAVPPRLARLKDVIDSFELSTEEFAETATREQLTSIARRLREQSIEDGYEISEKEAWMRANEIRARALGVSEEEIAAARSEFEANVSD